MSNKGEPIAVIVVGEFIVDVWQNHDGTPGITVSKETLDEWTDPERYLEADPPWADIFCEISEGRLKIHTI